MPHGEVQGTLVEDVRHRTEWVAEECCERLPTRVHAQHEGKFGELPRTVKLPTHTHRGPPSSPRRAPPSPPRTLRVPATDGFAVTNVLAKLYEVEELTAQRRSALEDVLNEH